MGCELLSVIIPIYNASRTLTHCLESVLGQSYPNLEVICVDDESRDESVVLCKQYIQTDNRVKLIQKKNGGVASARNEGMKYVTGEFLTFIDQDDWLEPDAYEKMMKAAVEEDADMVICGYSKDTDSVVQKMENRKAVVNPITDRNEMIRYAFEREQYRGYAAFVWNKIFRTEILKKDGIKFDTTLKRGDDVLFYSKFSVVAKKAIYIKDCLYHYVQRSDSITHTKNESNLYRLSDILTGYDRAIAYLDEAGIDKAVAHFLKCFYVYHASLLYETAEEFDKKDEMLRFRRAMEKYYDEYVKMNGSDKERMNRIERMIK